MKPRVEMVDDEPTVVFPTGEYQVYGSIAEAERAIERKWKDIDWDTALRKKRDKLAEAIKAIDKNLNGGEV